MSAPAGGAPRRSAVVRRIVDEARGVRSFTLALGEGARVDFNPGQFLRVRFPGEEDWRDYSISTPPPAAPELEITLAKAGRFTNRLFELRTGDRLDVEGPRGEWGYRDEGKPIVLVSGGTGITPFRSMVYHCLARGLPHPVSVFYSARTPEDLVFRAELEQWPVRGVPVVCTITRPQETAEGARWKGPVGRLTAAMIRERTPGFQDSVFYLCGPLALIQSLREALSSLGVPAASIRYDSWGEA